jgi:iron complex outermembrane recepter protein
MKRFSDQARLALLLAGVCAAPFALCAPAYAQDGAVVEEEEEITVTARRREENLQDVPIAVSAYSADQLDAAGARDITAIGETTPNVTFEASRATNSTITAFIRGVGQQDPIAGFEQGVGLYVDDVYLNRPQGALLDIYDIERLEVLRGPQGTLYGRNTIGGAVKYVTRRIDDDEATLRARFNYGSYNQADVILSGSTPITDSLRIGGAIAGFTRDGYGENLTTGEDNYNKDLFAIRLSGEWEPTDALLVRLSGDYTEDNSAPRQGHRFIPSLIPGNSASPLSNEYDTEAGITTLGPLRENRVISRGVQLMVDWSLSDNWTLRSITADRSDRSRAPIDFDSTPAPSMDAPALYHNDQFSQEVQLIYEGDRWHFVGGAYYLDANAFHAFDVVFTSATSFTLGDIDTETWAAFGEITFDFNDQWSLTLGGRYTEDTRRAHVWRETFLGVNSPYFGNAGAISITPPVFVGPDQVVPNFHGERTDEAFTPRAILAWAPSDALNLYASYSQGFKGGGFDPRGNFANADVRAGFLPEFVDSYEFGAKTSLWNGRINANTAIFYAEYTDVQIPGSVIVPGPPISFVGTVTNAGAAEFAGIEFEGTAQFTDGLRGQLSLGYIDAEYTEFVVGGVDVSNQRAVQNTPDWTGAAGLTYELPLTLGTMPGSISFSGGTSYRGDTQQFETAIPLLDQEGYWLFNAAVYWRADNDRLRLGVYGRNLGDERYITSGYNFAGAALDNSITAFYGDPLTVTGSIEVRF